LRREVPSKRGAADLVRVVTGRGGGGCAARAPAGAVTGSSLAGTGCGVQARHRA